MIGMISMKVMDITISYGTKDNLRIYEKKINTFNNWKKYFGGIKNECSK